MNKTQARRLLKLADFLESLPRNRFCLERWVGRGWEGKPDLSCGTTACALGWATTIPEFRKLGVRMKKETRANAPGPGLVGRREPDPPAVARLLFGIGDGNDQSWGHYWNLFFMSAYPKGYYTGAAEVAKRMRALVAKLQPGLRP